MKILLIHQFFILEEEPGGSRHVELLRHFVNQGFQVSVIGGAVNYMTNRSKLPFWKIYEKRMVSGFPVTWVFALPALRFGLFGKFLTYLSFFICAIPFVLIEKPDLILATSPPPTVGLLGWLLSRIRKIPWIFEIRDIWPDSGVDLTAISRGLLYHTLSRLVHFLYCRSGHIVTLTFGLGKSLQKAGVSPDKITTIPNGVDSFFLEPASYRFEELEALHSQNKFIVMYIGALGQANHVIHLLELAAHLKDNSRFCLLLIGDGQQKPELEKYALQHQLTNVRFLGSVPRKQVPSLLHYANACIAIWAKGVGFRQVLPNKLFDYMASGSPVILAAEEGDAWEILEKAQGGVRVDPDDLDSMKKWLLYFLEHPEEAKAMGGRGKAYVFQHFLRKDLARQYLEVIEKTAAEFQRPAAKKPQ